MSSKTISLSIIVAAVGVSAVILFSDAGGPKGESLVPPPNNAVIKGDIQTISLTAKGGFTPENTIAKAGVPTILKITTQGTFDCSSVVSIPELQIIKNLPNTGVTEIDLGVRPQGILSGGCGMGMYPFTIEFK